MPFYSRAYALFFITIESFVFCFRKLSMIECRTGSFHVYWAISFWRYVSLLLGNIFILFNFIIFYPLFSPLYLSGISINWMFHFFVWSSASHFFPAFVAFDLQQVFLIPWCFHIGVAYYFIFLRIPVRLVSLVSSALWVMCDSSGCRVFCLIVFCCCHAV